MVDDIFTQLFVRGVFFKLPFILAGIAVLISVYFIIKGQRTTGNVKKKAPKYSSLSYQLMLFNRYVVIDFETTGLHASTDKIIEVACLKCIDGVTSEYHSMVNPLIKIPEAASRINNIWDDDVKNAPDIKTVAKEIHEFCGDLPLVAHNAPFDVEFLKQAYIASGIDQDIDYADTLHLARLAYPNFPTHKLSYLVTTLGISAGQTHRAMDDVICTKKLLELCIAEIIKQESNGKRFNQLP